MDKTGMPIGKSRWIHVPVGATDYDIAGLGTLDEFIEDSNMPGPGNPFIDWSIGCGCADDGDTSRGSVQWRRYGTGRSITPDMEKQAREQLQFLLEKGTKAGEYLEKALSDGWTIEIVVANKDERQLVVGVRSLAGYADKADFGTKTISLTYDPRYGGPGYFVKDDNGSTKWVSIRDGTSVLAHELGHVFENIYNNNRTDENEAVRLENQVRRLQGYKSLTHVPDFDRYVTPNP